MLRTLHPMLSDAGPPSGRRSAAIAAVAGIHLVIGYALVTGMAARLVQSIPDPITLVPVQQPERKVDLTPPPVQPNDLVKPVLVTVPEPVIRIERPTPSPITVVHGPVQPVQRVVVVPPVTAPVAAVAPTRAVGIAGTHSTPPYPDLARRLGEEGMVVLNIALDAEGQITNVAVATSSGSPRLDDAAVAWVKARWRYKPATENGAAVASTVQAGVVFNLKHAQ